jgi:hypothetical protein
MSTPQQPNIWLIGHCSPDAWRLEQMIEQALPDAEVERVLDQNDLDPPPAAETLLLVNRVLFGRFALDNGIDLIGLLRDRTQGRIRAVLISDLPDAQQAAEQVGALPGFGKKQLSDPEAIERLQAAAHCGCDEQAG